MAYGFISILGMPGAFLMNHLYKKKKFSWALFVGFINITLSNLFNLFIITFTIFYMLSAAQDKIALPYLLLGYSVIIGSFQYMASHEPPDALGTWLGLFLIQAAYIIFSITFLFHVGFMGLLIILALMIYIQIFSIKFVQYELRRENSLL